MGAAGDMLCASLLQIHPDPNSVIKRINGLGLSGVNAAIESVRQCGIIGAHFNVKIFNADEGNECIHEIPHHGLHLSDICDVINRCELPEKVKCDAAAVYGLLADAESKVHGTPATHIHFHEVGTMDAITDIITFCLLMYELKPDEIAASPVHTGTGTVKCAHGILPVPAPATAELLKGIPSCGGDIQSELCTPTGAAIIKHFVSSFGAQPEMLVEKIGYGMGTKTFSRANCIRAFLGNSY